ncbi:hypothetical protein [Neobacillus bataviensis]|uniref:hypothetical protein n=1 Tax=Neobacillus bataviensis TaxID=220685 RepID=UPI001CC16DC6|nr:hypothetical protein [Neobacillus bataviensis]
MKSSFQEAAKQPNEKSRKIHFYLPEGYKIKDEKPNNIILKNGSKTYILFVNPQEDSLSKVVYNGTVKQYKQLNTNEKFTSGSKFGFLTIKELDDDQNELTVGIGGTKITTQTETSDLVEDGKAMMQIVNSVKFGK